MSLNLCRNVQTNTPYAKVKNEDGRFICEECSEDEKLISTPCSKLTVSKSKLNPSFCKKNIWTDIDGDGVTDFLCVEDLGPLKGRLWTRKGRMEGFQYTLSPS